MADNKIQPNEYRLIDAAVSDHDGKDVFYVQMPTGSESNTPREWYGQALASGHSRDGDVKEAAGEYYGRPLVQLAGGWNGVEVELRALSKILREFEFVDIVDMDIQGAEGPAIAEGFAEMDRRVKRLHVGTHSKEVEDQIRTVMTNGGWRNIWDFPCQTTTDTPFGKIAFGDGVQSWINPRFYKAEAKPTGIAKLFAWLQGRG